MQLADKAFETYRHYSGKDKAHFLNTIADNIEAVVTMTSFLLRHTGRNPGVFGWGEGIS